MSTKSLRANGFKTDKLAKTKGRREHSARERRIAETAERSRRNDLVPELTIVERPITELRPPQRRTRKNDPAHIERLCASISEFGFSAPVLVREGQVLDGWIRVVAAQKLGLERIPTIECSHLSDAAARALGAALNRTGELGEWDLDQLRLEFAELVELDIDLAATGFTLQEQDIILLDEPGEGEQGGEEEESDEDPAEPAVTALGDLWELGDHRILCGDARSAQSYQTLLEYEQAHAVLMDPPYNVPIEGNVSGLGKKVHDEFVMASGEMSDEEFLAFLTSVLSALSNVLCGGAVLFVFMDWRSLHRLYAAGEAAKLQLINLVVWFKQSGAMGALYRSAHELVAVFCKGSTPRCNNVALGRHGRDRMNVWCAPGANRLGSSAHEMLQFHATPKPVELCADALLDVTRPGEIVLDAFLGSGATLIAAEKTGRHCRAVELEPCFVDVSIRRWEKLTGEEAVLAATGESFAEVAARRSAEREEALGALSGEE